jgi:hypothetical protein
MSKARDCRWLAWLAAVSLAVPALPARGDAQAGKDATPVFALATTGGETLVGPCLGLGADGTVELAGDKLAPVKAGDWLTLRRTKIPLPAPPRGAHVVLTTGDRIPLAPKAAVKVIDNRLHFQPAPPLLSPKGTLEVPLSRVVMVWLACPENTEVPIVLQRQLLTGSRTRDLVVARTGDKIEGNLLSLNSAAACRLDSGKKVADVAWPDIAAIAFNTELLVGKPPPGLYYHLILADGTRLAVRSATLAKGAATLACQTLFDCAAQVPVEHVVALEVRQGPAVYLSDLKPRKDEHAPFVGTAWPLVADGSVTGGELCLAGSTFDKGLGMHAESRVVYDLDGQYRWFECVVGLDPEHGKKGRVRLRVLVDGKERDLGWNKELTAGDGPLTLRVDVGKARELTLEVLFGSFGDVQAHVNWADARLIK